MSKKNTVFVLFFFMISCSQKDIFISEQPLFRVNIGLMEDEIDIFQHQGLIYANNFNFTLRGGFFYLLNASSNRLMKFTSYGDILSLIYNPSTNPPLITDQQDRKITLQDFREPRAITVDYKNNVYIDSLATSEQQFSLSKENIIYDRTILKFDPLGNYLHRIGQEGVNGSNFPLIQKIYSNKLNDLIVVTRLLENWKIFWFDATGQEKFNPVTYNNNEMIIDSNTFLIESIIPDYNKPILYISVNPKVHNNLSSKVIITPPYPLETITQHFNFPTYDTGYQLIGVDQETNFYFISTLTSADKYHLYITKAEGLSAQSLQLESSFAELAVISHFDLTPEAILSSFIITNQGAEIVWWRLNNLLLSKDNINDDKSLSSQ